MAGRRWRAAWPAPGPCTGRSPLPGPASAARSPYAARLWEDVEWDLFDIVSVDAYRDAYNVAGCRDQLRGYHRRGKPVAVSEFGCCTARQQLLAGAVVSAVKLPGRRAGSRPLLGRASRRGYGPGSGVSRSGGTSVPMPAAIRR